MTGPIPPNVRTNNPTYRTPRCQVAFMGDTTIILDDSQLISVTTMKSLAEPCGSFEIQLLASANKSTWRGAVATGGPSGSDLGEGNYWLSNLRPMMLTQIILTKSRPIADAGFVTPAGEFSAVDEDGHVLTSGGKFAPNNLTMLGVIDSVTLEKSMTLAGPQRLIRVVGRDLGRAFTDDTHYSFAYPLLNPDVTQKPAAPMHYLSGSTEEINNTVGRYFIRDSSGTGASPWQRALTSGTVRSVVQAVFDNASGLDVGYANSWSIRDYLPKPVFSSDVGNIPIIALPLMQASGSVWSLLDFLVPKPFGEMFVETVGRGASLIIRRPPWGRPWVEQKMQIDKLIEPMLNSQSTASNTLGKYLSAKLGGARKIWENDEPTSGRCRVVDKPYHTLSDDDIISMSLGRSDREVINFVLTRPGSAWFQGESDPMSWAAVATPMLDVASVRRYGMRLLQQENRWWSPVGQPQEDGTSTVINENHEENQSNAKTVNCRGEFILDNLRLYFWFRDNAEYLSGDIQIAGNPDVRIGDHVVVQSLYGSDMLFYVEGVSNHWTYGHGYVTNVSVTRGQPRTLSSTVDDGLPKDVRQW